MNQMCCILLPLNQEDSKLSKTMEGKITRAGEWCGMHNPITCDSIVYHWCSNNDIGKKWVLSNSCEKRVDRSIDSTPQLSPLYKVTFSECDKYNLQLVKCTWLFIRVVTIKLDAKEHNTTLFSPIY